MPRSIQWLYPERIWAFSQESNSVYLTFDDGPIPEVTPWVLDELKKHSAKATFFCIGENIQKHPGIFRRIITEGHSVGNHTFNHLNGLNTETSVYIENVEKAERLFDTGKQTAEGSVLASISNFKNEHSAISSQQSLFRPPYGKLTSKQAKLLREKDFKIIMWSLLSYDYDQSVSVEKCLQNVIDNLTPGSIVVFHDSLKAEKNLRYVLPKVLSLVTEKSWNFGRL